METVIYSQTQRKNKSTGSLLLIIICGVFGSLFLASILQSIGRMLDTVYFEYLSYLMLAAVCYVVVKKLVTDYRYTVFKGYIAFEKLTGSRDVRMEVVTFDEIVAIRPRKDEKGTVATTSPKNSMVLEYCRDGVNSFIIFSPDKDFLSSLSTSRQEQ